jgi:8-oxo-dGTP diphosphatase
MKSKVNYPPVVVAVIVDSKGRLLVSQRSLSSAAPGKWQNPGGKVEDNENHYEALKREVKEETGMDIKAMSKLLFRFSDHENKFEVYFYKVEASGQPKAKEPDKLNSE